MISADLSIIPDFFKAFIHLDFAVIFSRSEVELVTTPELDELRTIRGRKKLITHERDVLGSSAGPNHHFEVVKEICEEFGNEGSSNEFVGLFAVRAMDECEVCEKPLREAKPFGPNLKTPLIRQL